MYRKYPYTNFHDINLDWIIEQIKKTQEQLEEIKSWRDNWNERLDTFEVETEELLNLYYKLEEDYIDFTKGVDNRFIELTNDLVYRIQQLQVELTNYINTTLNVFGYRLDAYENRLANMDDRINHIMDNIFITFKMINPFTGQEEQVLDVIDYLTSLHMVNGLTASEYDALELTAQYYDNKELTARDYDQDGANLLP